MTKYTRCDGTEPPGTPVVVILTLAAPGDDAPEVVEQGSGVIESWSSDEELRLGPKPRDPRSAVISGELAGCWHISRLFRAPAPPPPPAEMEADTVRQPLERRPAPRRYWAAVLRLRSIRPDGLWYCVASTMAGALAVFGDAIKTGDGPPGEDNGVWSGVICSLEIQELTEERARRARNDGLNLTEKPLGFCAGGAWKSS